MIKVFITDDQQIILNGLQRILTNVPGIEVTGILNNGDELLATLSQKLPDVLLLDIQMPGKSGIELAGIVRKEFPSVKIIALTNIDIVVQVKKMLQNGAVGYLLKDVSPAILVEAINAVHNGNKYLQDTVQQQLMSSMFDQNQRQVLTRREKEILQLITDEFTNQEMADKLFLSLRTVENHRNNLLQKLGVKNTAGLVKTALQEGLVN